MKGYRPICLLKKLASMTVYCRGYLRPHGLVVTSGASVSAIDRNSTRDVRQSCQQIFLPVAAVYGYSSVLHGGDAELVVSLCAVSFYCALVVRRRELLGASESRRPNRPTCLKLLGYEATAPAV
ncbi:hypothetical protein OUZ56_026011 [Daphnia magna]|uniref:Uncharacterized protein n=1 Tax=Daphnia magna TaxID=35525 RepID=A0ABQ9ZKL5_9CRUS|nr:hypothetical protein OUZ56_026011 [Daphnia magna]